MDAKLSSWALNQVPNPPTAIPNGSFPTQFPRIFTGWGDPKLYPDVVGIPGQLMALAVKGNPTGSCELVYGTNGQCPSLKTQDACMVFFGIAFTIRAYVSQVETCPDGFTLLGQLYTTYSLCT